MALLDIGKRVTDIQQTGSGLHKHCTGIRFPYESRCIPADFVTPATDAWDHDHRKFDNLISFYIFRYIFPMTKNDSDYHKEKDERILLSMSNNPSRTTRFSPEGPRPYNLENTIKKKKKVNSKSEDMEIFQLADQIKVRS